MYYTIYFVNNQEKNEFATATLLIILRVVFLRKIYKAIFIMLFCCVIFFGVAYGYLLYDFNQSAKQIEQKNYNVLYEQIPDSKGIALLFDDGSAILAQLEFKNSCVRLVDIPQFTDKNGNYNGYTVDFTIEVSNRLIEGLVDRVGGVNLDYAGKKMRYTGTQTVDLISRDNTSSFKKQLIKEVFAQISKNNFSKEDFVYIIENSKTDLSIIECIYWLDYIKSMSGRVSFVN